MAQAGKIYTCRSLSTRDFTGSIAQNAAEQEDIALPPSLAAGLKGDSRLRGIVILSVENLSWELWMFRKDTFQTGNIDTDSFAGYWGFDAATAVRIAATGLYYYYVDGLDVPIVDESTIGAPQKACKLHLALVNRSAAAKTANAAGAISVSLNLELATGW